MVWRAARRFPSPTILRTRTRAGGRYPSDIPSIFGPGRINAPGGGDPAVQPANETQFGTAVIYSLGPDGLGGLPQISPVTGNEIDFFRERGILGSGDDLQRVF